MFPSSSLRSAPGSSRPSLLGAGTNVFSEATLSRLRSRLRQSGAIMSSRSVVSRMEDHFEFEPVDVGEGHRATTVEQLLARLEQHGLRRRLTVDDDASAYAVDVAARADEDLHAGATQNGGADDAMKEPVCSVSKACAAAPSVLVDTHNDPDAREPHYYLCVPCELRLTRISRRAPQWRALEDVHFHFSSAAHRATASWMADDDIDVTLHTTPLVGPAQHYSRIFVNGIPTMLSRRPGGGDMFYPLPHEQDAVLPQTALRRDAESDDGGGGKRDKSPASHSSSQDSGTAASKPFPLFASANARGECGGAATALWHRALPSVYTGQVQLLRRMPRKEAPPLAPGKRRRVYRVHRRIARAQVYVDHIDPSLYRAYSLLPVSKAALTPLVVPVRRERIPKALLDLRASEHSRGIAAGTAESLSRRTASLRFGDPHRVVYTQPFTQLAEGRGGVETADSAAEPPMPMTVFEDECYRVALVSEDEQLARRRRLEASASPSASTQQQEATARRSASLDDAPVVLTRELLTQHTQATSQEWRPSAVHGGSSGAADPSLLSFMARESQSRQSSLPRSSLPPSGSQSASQPVSSSMSWKLRQKRTR